MRMARYCDPKDLEDTWWAFILAEKTPSLESIRREGCLWTRISPGRAEHCVASSKPHRFVSVDGIIDPQDLNRATRASFFPLDTLVSRQLSAENFTLERSKDETWEKLSSMIYKICCGVSLNFHLHSDDLKDELVHEAFSHILTKIRRGKLIFTPGKAPPFNLLTTAIFRVMYSIKNKEKRDRDRRSQFVEQLMSGASLPELNSINISRSLIGYGAIKT